MVVAGVGVGGLVWASEQGKRRRPESGGRPSPSAAGRNERSRGLTIGGRRRVSRSQFACGLLSLLSPCFSQPAFQTLRMLLVGFVGQIRECTATGMLQDAGLAGEWHHSRAHDFFARRRWTPTLWGWGCWTAVSWPASRSRANSSASLRSVLT